MKSALRHGVCTCHAGDPSNRIARVDGEWMHATDGTPATPHAASELDAVSRDLGDAISVSVQDAGASLMRTLQRWNGKAQR